LRPVGLRRRFGRCLLGRVRWCVAVVFSGVGRVVVGPCWLGVGWALVVCRVDSAGAP